MSTAQVSGCGGDRREAVDLHRGLGAAGGGARAQRAVHRRAGGGDGAGGGSADRGGHCHRGMVLAALVALGLGPLLARSEELLLTVKLVGAAYLVVLGVRTLLSAGRHGGLASKTVRGEAPP